MDRTSRFRSRLHEIIFEADTLEGRLFDIVILGLIIISVAAVILESVASVNASFGDLLRYTEWACTIAFTLEYILRLYCVKCPLRYATSFFGVIDLLAVLPAYISFLFPGVHHLLVIRTLRLLRIFRVMKLARYMGESSTLVTALSASRRKIGIFLFAVFNIVVVVGTLMYVVEGPAHGFTDIPTSMYWAIVTLTTVGYGDLSPATPLGRLLASFIMIVGYGIIAVPTGIVTVELGRAATPTGRQACPSCGRDLLAVDVRYCSYCGEPNQG